MASEGGPSREQVLALKAKFIRERGMSESGAGIAAPQLEQAGPDDPAAGVETALSNTWEYAIGVAKTVQEEFFLGYGDELSAIAPATFKYILAGPDGKKSWGQIYEEVHTQELRDIEKFRKENPTAANLAAGTGMALPAVFTMGASMGPTAVRAGAKTAGLASTEALKRPNFIRRSAQGAAAAGGYGAVYGSGKAEGGIEERLAGAVEPGAVGAAMGSAIPIVGAIARPIIAHLKKRKVAKAAGIGVGPRKKFLGIPVSWKQVNTRAIDPIQEALHMGSRGAPGGVKEPVPETFWADIYANTRGLYVESLEKLGRFGLKGRGRY